MELDDKLRSKIAAYHVSQKNLEPIRHAPLLIIVGITGAGKNALLDYLIEKYPSHYQFIVSHTTRPKRDYEKQDVHYHFADFPAIEKIVDRGDFIEVQVVHFENVYGTSISEIERAQDAHKIACTDLDIQGTDDYLALGLNTKAVFLLPPNYDIWKERLLARYEESGEIDYKDLRNRLKSALIEIQHALDSDSYYIVVNDELSKTAELVNHIAHGEVVEPHHHRAVTIANDLARQLREDLDKLKAKLAA